MLKRFLDAVVSAAALVVLSPVLLAIAIRIKLSSPGPVFYRGLRVGRFGKTFRILKFRTMVVDAERVGGSATADDDPRITTVGMFLRKRKLDEFPQLWNVLLGDMSLVGPRPEVPQYVALYNDAQKAILTLRPGITDWASLWDCDEGAFLAGSPDPERAYLEQILPEKLRLQLEYVRRRSFRTDLSILAKTLQLVLRRKYQRRSLSERASLGR
jgi:lipopolysaccharide/colanic/teichoic acid biosynthesis glycosyltransferase